MNDDLFNALSQLIDPAGIQVWDSLELLWREQVGQALNYPASPPAVWVRPNTTSELATVVQACHVHHWPLMICGQRSKISWGQPLDPVNLILSTQHLTQIIDHAVPDLTITVETGLRLADLQRHLQQTHQFWPVNPMYPDSATIGGIIATADTGSWRHRYGGIRDLVLGLQWIRSDGQLAKAGGRVVKNVAGYDLMKLMTGAYGTLGVLTEATLRLYPRPEQQARVIYAGPAEAIDALRYQLLDSTLTPVAVDLVSAAILVQLNPQASSQLSSTTIGLIIEFHGLTETVKLQLEQVAEMAPACTLIQSQMGDDPYFESQLAQCLSLESPSFLAKLGLLPNQATQGLLNLVEQFPQSLIQIQAASGVGRWRLPPSTISPIDVYPIRSSLIKESGFLSILEAPVDFKTRVDVWGYSPAVLKLMQQVQHQFDPQSILNPDRLGLNQASSLRAVERSQAS